ncbi:MAG: S1/P1 Nuclease, partial [Bacteroidetes bacterium]
CYSFKPEKKYWGFFGHKKINYYAIFLLPPEMMVFYKPNIEFLVDHAVDPDKRRYMVPQEGPRHYIDLDHYGTYPFDSLPRNWMAASKKFGPDSLKSHGIVPWWTMIMLQRLTNAFTERNKSKILKLSAEIGHYIADAHVPLHTSSNHNGQLTNQIGIHGFWESRVPELLADDEFDFYIGKAAYLVNPSQFIWQRVLESAKSVDSVLAIEKSLTNKFGAEHKYSFENRNGKIVRQYSSAFTRTYNLQLQGMVERRMRASIFAVASFWYTAWVNAGRPKLSELTGQDFNAEDLHEFEELDRAWNTGKILGRTCDN